MASGRRAERSTEVTAAEKAGFLDRGKHSNLKWSVVVFGNDMFRATQADEDFKNLFVEKGAVHGADVVGVRGIKNTIQFTSVPQTNQDSNQLVLFAGDKDSASKQRVIIQVKHGVSRESAEQALRQWLREEYPPRGKKELTFLERSTDVPESSDITLEEPQIAPDDTELDGLLSVLNMGIQKSELGQIQGATEGLRTLVQELRKEVADSAILLDELGEKLSQTIREYDKELKKLRQQNLRLELRETRQRIAVTELQSDGSMTSDPTKTDGPTTEEKRLQGELDILIAKHTELKGHFEDAQQAKEDQAADFQLLLLKAAETHRSDLSAKQLKLEAAVKAATEAEAQVKSLSENIQALENANATLEQGMQDVRKRLEDLAGENTRLSEQVSALQTELGAKNGQIGELTAERDRIASEASAIVQKESSLRAAFAGQAGTIERLNAKLTELQAQVEAKAEVVAQPVEQPSLASMLQTQELSTQQTLVELQNQKAALAVLKESREKVWNELASLEVLLKMTREAIQAKQELEQYDEVARLATEAHQLKGDIQTLKDQYEEVGKNITDSESGKRSLSVTATDLETRIKKQQSVADALALLVRSLSEVSDSADLPSVETAGQLLTKEDADMAAEDYTPMEQIDESKIEEETISVESAEQVTVTQREIEAVDLAAEQLTELEPNVESEVANKAETNEIENWVSGLSGFPVCLLYTESSRRMFQFASIFKNQQILLEKGINLEQIVRVIIDCYSAPAATQALKAHRAVLGLNNKTINAIMEGIDESGFFDETSLAHKRSVIQHLVDSNPKIVENAQAVTKGMVRTKPVVVPVSIPPETPKMPTSEVVAPLTRSEDLDKEIKLWISDLRGQLVQLLYTTSSKKEIAADKRRKKSTKELWTVKNFELGAVASIVVRANTLDEMEKKLGEFLRKVRITRKAARSIIGAIKSGAEELKLYDKKDIADRLDAVAVHVSAENKDNERIYRLMSEWKKEQNSPNR